MAHKHIHQTPPERFSSSLVTESNRSYDSNYSCITTDEIVIHSITENTTVYSDWTFNKCLNDNYQSKIDMMKNNITNERCVRKLYFKRENRDFCKYGINEWNIVMGISHPNIIEFKHFHRSDKFVAILMPYYKTDLFNKLERELKTSHFTSPSSISDRLSMLLTIYSTIKYIHGENIVHRDLKPENIVLNDSGEPILIDFGFASKTKNNMLRNDKKGTPLYVAPEIYLDTPFNGKCADVFSLGSMSWIIIFGCQPWNNERTDSFYETLHKMPMNNLLYTFQTLVKEMTLDNPKNRPDISECVKRLNDINNAYFSCDDVMHDFLMLPT